MSPETFTVLVCQKCGHEWWPRVPDPRRCPKCTSTHWNG